MVGATFPLKYFYKEFKIIETGGHRETSRMVAMWFYLFFGVEKSEKNEASGLP